ncbi:MAG: hypothetical protein P1P88_25820 [Bacteroidales bacterium]|nr:hypothetical protein [Bacteroidales bacterium]
MRKIKLISLLIIIPVAMAAQSLDCPSTLKLRRSAPPYSFNDLSKSAQCFTGKKYEFMVPLMKGKDYRLTFFASPIFNNDINFRIIDMNSGDKVLDLPGESQSGLKGESVLREYFDQELDKVVHPYFDFYPSSSTTLKIIIEVAGVDEKKNNTESSFKAPEERKKGCITVFIQDKKSEEVGFQ